MSQREILPGGLYRHFKGTLYRVAVVARHTETDEDLVVYQAADGTGPWYARPLAMFLSPVDRKKYPQAEQHDRFELVDPAQPGKREEP